MKANMKTKKKKYKDITCIIHKSLAVILALILAFSLCSCGTSEYTTDAANKQNGTDVVIDSTDHTSGSDHKEQGKSDSKSGEDEGAYSKSDEDEGAYSKSDEDEGAYSKSDEDEGACSKLDEDGAYYSKEDVALYLYTYEKLPSNYITKTEAKKLGWEGGSVERYAKGKAIGGDKFGNYEGLLPKDKKYYECDIDTNGKESRGAKRIIYSSDYEYVYYTEDHYASFELIERSLQ